MFWYVNITQPLYLLPLLSENTHTSNQIVENDKESK
jgi:hypothetical protein